MKKFWKICIAVVLLIAVLVSVNRLCFANFDSTAGFQLAEKTAQKEIAKLYPNLDLTEAEVDVSCSVQTRYCFGCEEKYKCCIFGKKAEQYFRILERLSADMGASYHHPHHAAAVA